MEIPIMVMPWHRPDPCKALKMQTAAAFKSSYMDYLATLRLDSPPLEIPLSTIAGTIGPASNNVDMLVDLMEQGLSIALVPLALGTRQDQLDMIANIRAANASFANMRGMVYPLAIAVQTKGPGLRLGGLYKDMPYVLPLHHKLTLTTDKAWRTKGTEHYIYINFPEMCHVLKEGDILLVGSGIVILQVEFVDKSEVKCVVAGGGTITSFMAVSIPDVPLNLPPLTDEDVDDLVMAADMGVDIVLASQTQTEELVKDVRKILDEHDGGSGIKIWAQIESSQGLNNLDKILEVADGIVFSRISLLQDVPAEKLFLAQKIVLSTCNKAGVPVFVSSHFLPSMQVATSPTISEVYDVTAAILDGVDGFLMRNTVSHGKHPETAVRTLTKICVEAEAAVWHHQTFDYLNEHAPVPVDPTHSIAIAAVEASLKSNAALILLATTSGRSAQLVARYRPRCPIIAITRYGQVARLLNSWRAITPLHYVDPPLPEWTREVDVRFQFGIEYAKHRGMVKPGDVMVLLNGWRQGAGFTNTIRVVYASDSFPWVYPHKLPDAIPSDSDVNEGEEGGEEDEEARSKSGAGEPVTSESRIVQIVDKSSSAQSASIESRIKTMQDDYTKTAFDKTKEMEEKLAESLQSLKTESQGRKSLDKTKTKGDRSHSLLEPSKTVAKPTKGGTVLPSGQSTAQTRRSGTGSTLESKSSAGSKRGSKSTVASGKHTTTVPNKTVVEGKTETTMPNKTVVEGKTETAMPNKTVVEGKTETTMPNKTVIEGKTETVMPNKTVVEGKTKTAMTNKTVVEGKTETAMPNNSQTVVDSTQNNEEND